MRPILLNMRFHHFDSLLASSDSSIGQDTVDNAQTPKANLDELKAERSEVEFHNDSLNGEDRNVFAQAALELKLAELDNIHQEATLAVKPEADGTDAAESRTYVMELIVSLRPNRVAVP